jgi:hypothetical protein
MSAKSRSSSPVKTSRIQAFIASNDFFWLALGILIGESVWIAFTARYPMAFDEDFHFGIIKIYAHHISPFLTGQPQGADAFGAVARDPSYLYQYLMSFPYRLLELITHNQVVQIVILRLINVVLFASAIPIFRRVLLRVNISHAIINIAVLLFAFVPIAPLLAGQINYDNLLIPLFALSLLLTIRLIDKTRLTGRLSIERLGWLLVLCLLASLVKYAFLPIFAAIGLSIIVWVYINRRRGIRMQLSLLHLKPLRSISLVVMLLVSIVLFSQRYAINLVEYHSPVPDCSQVLSVEHCAQYGSWHRNYEDSLTKNPGASGNPLAFTVDWFYGMWFRLFFAVDGPTTHYETRGPLIIPSISAVVLTGFGITAIIIKRKLLIRRIGRYPLALIFGTTIFYTVALWVDEYQQYQLTATPVAINGRYLLPLLIPIGAIAGLAIYDILNARWLQTTFAVLCIVSFIWGGGLLTYIIRSNSAWYWQNTIVIDVNHKVQSILIPLVPGSRNPSAFMNADPL